MSSVLDRECPQMSTNASVCRRMNSVCRRMTSVLCVWLPLNTLLNRQAYAKMSIYVADTPEVRYSYAINTLAVR